MITSIRNHGFRLKFDSGFTVNVMYSTHSSCDRYSKDRGGIYDDYDQEQVGSFTAEVTVTDNNDKVVIFEGESSLRYQNSTQVAAILFKASIACMAEDMLDFDISHVKKVNEWE